MRPITLDTSNSKQAPNPNAQIAVQLCYITSSDNPTSDIGVQLPGWKIVWNGTQTKDANYAFIAVDSTGNNYALAIRGSVPPNGTFSDWDVFANWILEDLDILTHAVWPYAITPKPRVSTGSHIAFTNMLDMRDPQYPNMTIEQFLQQNAVGNGKQLIITGHSLGGNIANLYASYYVSTLLDNKIPVDNISLFTFAAPAAGNMDFATDLGGKLANQWHYQNAQDVVPNFPTFDGMLYVSTLYWPNKPEALQIEVTFQNQKVNLQEALMIMAGMLSLLEYHQPSKNYIIFENELDSQYNENTVGDWLGQGGYQHQVFNYANYLGVQLLVKQSALELV